MGPLENRVRRLEESMGVRPPAGTPEWPLEEQIRDAVSYLWWHVHFDSVAACTDQQLRCIGLWLAREEHPDALLADLSPVGLADFPPEVREHVSRLEPRMQPERDAWLRKKAGHFVREVEEMPARLAAVEEAQRRQAEESRRRDLELLHRNRARCGLPPLETEIPD